MKQSSGEASREDAKMCLRLGNPTGREHQFITVTLRCSSCDVSQGEPRRATARLQWGRASFEAPGAMLSHRATRTSG